MPDLEISLPSNRLARKRLTDPASFAPWVRAEKSELPDCTLFWLPVSGYPVRVEEKSWLDEFLRRLSELLAREHGLRAELFFRYKLLTGELGDTFRSYGQHCMKLMGIGRYADTDLPTFPSAEEIQSKIDKGETIDFRDWIGDFLLWFISKQPERQRELFLGHGGLTTIFLPPDPKVKMPKLPFTPALRQSLSVFQKVDVDGILLGTISMQDAFLEKSKALFGAGLEHKPEYPGIAFVLPLLDSAHFFMAPAELRANWFSLFDLYVTESQVDKGVLLAFAKEEYEVAVLDVLESMRNDNLLYLGQER